MKIYRRPEIVRVSHFGVEFAGYLPEKRQSMVDMLIYYANNFSGHLKWGFVNDPYKIVDFQKVSLQEISAKIMLTDRDDLDFIFCSDEIFSFSSNYRFGGSSPADWYETIHKSVSYISFHLPITELESNQKNRLEEYILHLCNELKPMHGVVGLGIQQCYENEKYQHIEYEIAQDFLAIDITNANYSKQNRDGIRTINWYTFIQDKWLAKLGGEEQLKAVSTDAKMTHMPM